MSLSNSQLDAQLRNTPLPEGLLSRLREIPRELDESEYVAKHERECFTDEARWCDVDAQAEIADTPGDDHDTKYDIDAILRDTPLPFGFTARLKQIAASEDPAGREQGTEEIASLGNIAWGELAAALRSVTPPDGMRQRLQRIPFWSRHRDTARRMMLGEWVKAASIVTAVLASYIAALLLFVTSSMTEKPEDPVYFVMDRPLMASPSTALHLPAAARNAPVRTDDATDAAAAPQRSPRFGAEVESTQVALQEPPLDQPAGGMPDPIDEFDRFQAVVAPILVAYPWESPLRDVPDIVGSPIAEGPAPEIVPWLPTGVSAGLDPPPFRGFDGAFFYRRDEWPVILLNRDTDPRLHTCQAPLRVGADSYELAKRYLSRKPPRRPPPEDLRKEDFLSALDYDLLPPHRGGLAVSAFGGPSPFDRPGMFYLLVGVQARHVADVARPTTHLVLAVDISQSMKLGDRLALVRRALKRLPEDLSENDRVSLIVFRERAEVLGEAVSSRDAHSWREALDGLSADGGTNLVGALRTAYTLLGPVDFNPDEIVRRIVLVTDGMSPLDDWTQERLFQAAASAAATDDVALHVVDVSPSSRRDNEQLKSLAQAGGGTLVRAGTRHEVRGAVLQALRGRPQVVAEEAELSVTFNPAMVRAFRQIGHEPSRAKFLQLSGAGAEGGAAFWSGQQAVALFEVELRPNVPGGGFDMTLLRDTVATAYLSWNTPSRESADGRIPGETRRQVYQFSHLQLAGSFREAALPLQTAVLASESAEVLADSVFSPRTTLKDVLAAAETASSELTENESFAEFWEVVKKASLRARVKRK